MIHFITGGQRSGKSSYGEKLALEKSRRPVYLATSRIWDEDHKERIRQHRERRDERWETLEEPLYISNHNLQGRTVLMDCLTLWLTNFFTDYYPDHDTALQQALEEADNFLKMDMDVIIISNEIGMGMHADTDSGRKFTDILGKLNQHVAAKADEATFMVAGLPVKIKPST